MGVPVLATDFPCSVWCHGFTTCPLYAGSFVKINFKRQLVCKSGIAEHPSFIALILLCIGLCIYLNISDYSYTLFFVLFALFSYLKWCFIFAQYYCALLFHRRNLDAFYHAYNDKIDWLANLPPLAFTTSCNLLLYWGPDNCQGLISSSGTPSSFLQTKTKNINRCFLTTWWYRVRKELPNEEQWSLC